MLLLGDKMVVCQRDNKPGLRFAGLWDLPGGGRENNETPVECIIRELKEELNIGLAPDSVFYTKEYPAMHDSNQIGIFMAAKIKQTTVDKIVLGSEGQGWKLMNINEFLESSDTIEPIKGRIRDYLKSQENNRQLS